MRQKKIKYYDKCAPKKKMWCAMPKTCMLVLTTNVNSALMWTLSDIRLCAIKINTVCKSMYIASIKS